MKKGKRVMTITIGLVCFVLTYVMFMQFKIVEQTNIEQIENMQETDLREKLASWRTKQSETSEKLAETRQRLLEYREKRASNQEASELLQKELLQAQTIAGETNVKGEGVIITLVDKEKPLEIKARDLIILINELKLAGAEAISINEQRIVNMSDIVDINTEDGAQFILVNKKRVVAPYIVKAIGDQKYLESALTTKKVGYMDQYSENASMVTQNNIVINKYEGKIELKYANVKEEM